MATKNNGIQLTEAEQAEHEAAQAVVQADEQTIADAKVIDDAKLASGKTKLKNLGLDDAEIKQLTGA